MFSLVKNTLTRIILKGCTIVLVRNVVAVLVGTIAVEIHRDTLEAITACKLFVVADDRVGGVDGWARRHGLWKDIKSSVAKR